MEETVKAILKNLYDLNVSALRQNKRGWQNIVYEVETDTADFIMRCTPKANRGKEDILGEAEWLLHLKNHLEVPSPVATIQNNYCIDLEDTSTPYYFVLFDKIEGQHISYNSYLNRPELFYKLGVEIGKVHANSRDFTLKRGTRRQWHDNQYLQEFGQHIPKNQIKVYESCALLVEEIKKATEGSCDYGLVHGDIHHENFLFNEDRLIIIDYDESQYSLLCEDFSVALYYTLYGMLNNNGQRDKIAKEFCYHFQLGYKEQFSDACDLSFVPLYLRLRELIAYVGAYKKWDFDHLSAWQAGFLQESRQRIENHQPIFQFQENKWSFYAEVGEYKQTWEREMMGFEEQQ
ncbi:phosphotransferase enzyme family protein [Vagococcus elongatus]|uniref:Aminoglycoside phosphotransferase domain-containing protein n=1 Tax=Vagococcus elongatus TaxID=180344 RepID=A0A430AV01_9ENTE|nr:phosphotransferase [Vagococcus elongatus]RSU11887.1 hypothetical protein CBF29_07145 [Vagococcus elongatus]